LTRLYDKGRLDLLRAIRAGTLTVTEVYAADRQDTLNALTGDRARLAAPLWTAVDAWTPMSAKAPATPKRYAISLAALRRTGVLKTDATVEQLGAVDWRALEAAWPRSAADWDHLRRAVSHFLSMHLGDVYRPLAGSW